MSFEENAELDFLFAEAKLGIAVEEWLASDVGKYMKGRAEGELEDIKRKLIELPEWQSSTAKQLQDRAKMLQTMMSWLAQAIDNGHVSEMALQEAESGQ
ncbi:hypothetical protein [Pontibacterium sp.]|uniref:hypothetical protein n=1 Tax=Pontibacterium sp. TaxID=2036026 RepID=UPI003567A37C